MDKNFDKEKFIQELNKMTPSEQKEALKLVSQYVSDMRDILNEQRHELSQFKDDMKAKEIAKSIIGS